MQGIRYHEDESEGWGSAGAECESGEIKGGKLERGVRGGVVHSVPR